MSQDRSAADDKALALLGQGFSNDVVSSASGLSLSRISQLLSEEEFANEVSELRFKNLVKHTEQDEKIDAIESKLVEMLEDALPFVEHKPLAIAKLYSQVNAAKRRGASAPAHIEKPAESVTLNMPIKVVNKFIMNVHNQVIQAGQQELITVQSSGMDEMLKHARSRSPQNETALLERTA